MLHYNCLVKRCARPARGLPDCSFTFRNTTDRETGMTHDITLRTLSQHEALACSEQLADVLIDCVEGGA